MAVVERSALIAWWDAQPPAPYGRPGKGIKARFGKYVGHLDVSSRGTIYVCQRRQGAGSSRYDNGLDRTVTDLTLLEIKEGARYRPIAEILREHAPPDESAIAHVFRGRPSACVYCDRLERKMTAKERKTPCDAPRWEWTVTGTQESTGTMGWAFEESGIVLGMGYGYALINLVSWSDAPLDALDSDEEFTITMRRLHEDEDQ